MTKRSLWVFAFAVTINVIFLVSCNSNTGVGTYKGTPFGDSIKEAAAQVIPGKVQCEYFDF